MHICICTWNRFAEKYSSDKYTHEKQEKHNYRSLNAFASNIGNRASMVNFACMELTCIRKPSLLY